MYRHPKYEVSGEIPQLAVVAIGQHDHALTKPIFLDYIALSSLIPSQ